MSNVYIRENKEGKPVIAICYDFDKTLTCDDMQSQGLIQELGFNVKNFWDESNKNAEDFNMDMNIAWMKKIIDEAYGKLLINKKYFKEYANKLTYYNGVVEWFKRINEYAQTKNVIVEHYVISSGLKEIIESSIIGKEFKKIYASSFYYDDKEVPIWPSQVINYTNKTQYLFRIEKGTLNENDEFVNHYYDKNELRVPFRNIIYIGDSATDIPCMKLVKNNGGSSICVYDENKNKALQMMKDHRINYFAKADYSKDSELDVLVRHIIDNIKTTEILLDDFNKMKLEKDNYIKNVDETKRNANILINALSESNSFANTHDIVWKLRDNKILECLDQNDVDLLIKIALDNNQVKWIIGDKDIFEFYILLIKKLKNGTDNSKKLYQLFSDLKIDV